MDAAVIFLLPANPLIAITLNPCLDKLEKDHNNMISFLLRRNKKKIE